MPSTDELIALGREVVNDGRLHDLRIELGFSATYMAEMLMTNVATYRTWERRPETKLWITTALRVGRFFVSSRRTLDELGVSLADLVPLHAVAPRLGITHELLLHRYRQGEFEAVDLGILGLWVPKERLVRS